MTTNELIKALKEADPEGQQDVMVWAPNLEKPTDGDRSALEVISVVDGVKGWTFLNLEKP
jgi:hypothetical protein